jgi:hypothetical protein
MPAISFIDELDALGGDRGDFVYGGINAIEAMTFTTGRVRRLTIASKSDEGKVGH